MNPTNLTNMRQPVTSSDLKPSPSSRENIITYGKTDLKICAELGLQDLYRLRLVCKEWKQIAEETDLWKKYYGNKSCFNFSKEKKQPSIAYKKETFKNPSTLISLSSEIYEQILPSFDNLTNDELKKIMNKDVFSSKASLEQAEKAYTLALQIAVQKKDTIQESFCIEKLGDIYLAKRTSETLLQAAGLYNYALRVFSEDMKKQEVLKEKLSMVQQTLIYGCQGEILDSSSMSKQFTANREALKEFRKIIETKVQVLGSNPSSEKVRDLYKEIAKWMKDFFEILAKQSIDTLGAVPCEYAMIGFGSLAREEMTPYSDLEFGILIQEDSEDNRKYFKRLTTLIHLSVINLGETILPALNIPCIKDASFFDSVTPRGFAFDGAGVEEKGCKTPFGNNGKTFELIQTPEKMAQYIAKDKEGQWWHKKEPHLPMELLNFTHLLGNLELTDQYKEKIQEKLKVPYQEPFNLRQYLAMKHLFQADMATFNPVMNELERQGMLFKVKNDLYRFPHLALDRLALLKEITASDTFGRIEELNRQDILTEGAAEKLKDWMSIALFMRLKTYSHYQAQREMMNPLIQPFSLEKPQLIKEHFTFNKDVLKQVEGIYRTFIPFYQGMIKFLSGDESILKSSDLNDDSFQTRGDIALRLYQHEEATKCYLSAIEANQENSELLNSLGILYQEQGVLADAIKYIEKALDTDLKLFSENPAPVARDYNNLGQIYLEQGKLVEAAEYIRKALEIDLKLFNENPAAVARDYNNLGLIYINDGKLNEAFEYISQALAINEKFFKDNPLTTAIHYNNLTLVYIEQGMLDEATKCIKQALDISLKLLGEDHSNVARLYTNWGAIYEKQYNFEKAAEKVSQALDIDLVLFGKKHPTVAHYYNNLGMIYREQGKLEKAAEYVEQALDIGLQLYDKKHFTMAVYYTNLGMIYYDQRDLKKALHYAKQAHAINCELLGGNHLNVVKNYNNLGLIYQEKGKPKEAIRFIKQALANRSNFLGKSDFMFASLYNNLGTIYREQGKLEKAAEHIEQALSISLNLYGKDHAEVANYYNNLGTIYHAQGKLEKAADYSTQALIVARKLYGETHPNLAKYYNNLGMIYKDLGTLEKAAKYVEQALNLDLQIPSKIHPNIAKYYNNLGMIHKDLGNLEKAAKYVEQALNIDLQLSGETHPDLLTYYNNLQAIYLAQEDLEKTIKYINKAVFINRMLHGETHSKIASLYNKLASIHKKQGKFEEAAKHLNQAISIAHKRYSKPHPKLAKYYSDLGMIYQDHGKLQEAIKSVTQALDIHLKLFGENHPTVATDYNNLGMIYKDQGKLEEAARYVHQAVDIHLELHDEDHATLANYYNNLGVIYQAQKQLEKAAEYARQALNLGLRHLAKTDTKLALYYYNLGIIYQELRQARRSY
ncbi:DUF2225 domain-containing protein [Neochlamydia sp. S13]|uniref:DUF2225 domain-containing protein n=1 Tax=Neochlamydia sp. S13 TaxID=1353976 RepID=UPI0009AC3249|nr:DUF2225 domain-containing protein [Neochlamydia sp. S13]BBI16867.1 hypothetical protein NCS13_1_0672 [Neochlamydia sp. S13]